MDSESSISEKPQNANLGLGLTSPDLTPIDPMSDQGDSKEFLDPQNAPCEKSDRPKGIEEEVKDKAVDEEDVKLRDAIEKEIHQLTLEQAEIEGAPEKGHLLYGDHDEGNEVKTVINENADEEKEVNEEKGYGLSDGNDEGDELKTEKNENTDEEKDVEYTVNENGDEDIDEQDVKSWKEDDDRTESYNENESNAEVDKGEGESGEMMVKGGRNGDYKNRKFQYPQRSDAEDCSFYMKTGSCKFGSGCKFNHPPTAKRKNQDVKERAKQREGNPERAGQIECKYYLTSGGCKYGKACKYYHDAGKSPITPVVEFNFLGLPIRLGERECPYYMRNGSCKYGSNCRFHHPDPEPGGKPPSGYGNGGSLPPPGFSSSSASSWSSPRALNETAPFVPVMLPTSQVVHPPKPEWNGYQAAPYPTSERSLPTPPAFSMNKLQTDMSFPIQHQLDMVIEEYPERPGEPECSFFLKTGDCKYKANCKFHHPKKRISKPKTNSCALNDKGLPLRPDQPICTHYHRYGICKYGPGCKYDHPANFAIAQPPPSPPPPPPPYGQPPFNSSS